MTTLMVKGFLPIKKDAQSTNDKVEALSIAKEESVGSHSNHSRSSYSSREERRERHERHRTKERRERRYRREEDRRDGLDLGKCTIPPFVGNCKPEIYID
ncbi:hypothetical protein CR513_06837, partial [Mucuna pruriens]